MPPAGSPALEVRELDLSYDRLQVLFGVNLEVAAGEALALLGTNGAGKSSFLRAVAGLVRPSAGHVLLNGDRIDGMPAHHRVKKGLVLVPGGRAIFPSLSVSENLTVGSLLLRHDRRRALQRREDVLDLFPILRERLSAGAGSLSGGQQQQLAIAKGLLLEPSVLCIDELSLGLAPVVVEELLVVMDRLKREGIAVVLVEQSLNIAVSIADRAVFLEKGHVRFEGPTEDLKRRDDIARAVFLGSKVGS